MNQKLFLRRLLLSQTNVRFADLVELVEAFGFRERRHRGSHRMFSHPHIADQLNLQSVDGEAKPYQVRQFLRLVELYNLSLGEDA